jgi:hypothetical protein
LRQHIRDKLRMLLEIVEGEFLYGILCGQFLTSLNPCFYEGKFGDFDLLPSCVIRTSAFSSSFPSTRSPVSILIFLQAHI